jgi:hypothetical protein
MNTTQTTATKETDTMSTQKFDRVKFITPPRNQGQMVIISYGDDFEGAQLVERTQRPGEPDTYRTADWTDDAMADVEFEPWNAEPGVPEDMWEDED